MKQRASSLSAARPKTPAALRRKVLVVHRRLLKRYGEPEPPARRGDALGELIACILSQHTSDLNSGRAYESLRARFPTWELVRDAPPRAVVAAIRSSGLANQKGPRIQSVLRTISRDVASSHALDINFLADWPVPKAKAWLLALHGVGPKTAAITLLFGLGRPAFPVDTHVHRVAGKQLHADILFTDEQGVVIAVIQGFEATMDSALAAAFRRRTASPGPGRDAAATTEVGRP